MDALIMAAQLILGLMILVGIHELGHMLTAKWFGMRVEKFSIGFPPKIFSFKKGETEYALGAIPLGGFVKISGMIDESMDKDFLNSPPQPWEFRAKPAWQRLIVMMGGIIFNVVLGCLIFSGVVFFQGESYLPAKEVKYGVISHELGQQLGIRTGDKIVKVNGHTIEKFYEIVSPEVLLGENCTYTVERNGQLVEIKIPNDFIEKLSDQSAQGRFVEPIFPYKVAEVMPGSQAQAAGLQEGDIISNVNGIPTVYFHELQKALSDNKNKDVAVEVNRAGKVVALKAHVNAEGKLGFRPEMLLKEEKISYGLGASVVKGSALAFSVVSDNIKGFAKMFRGEVDPRKSLSGPIGIAQIYSNTWDWSHFWKITGLLSMVLAFMNFLPIPALDGGHVMFLTYEMVSGRKPSDKFLEVAQRIGMAILLGLMLFAIFNDVAKLDVIRRLLGL